MSQWNNRILISRSGEDEGAAIWAARILEEHGYECVIQTRDFPAGESFPQKLREAFETCDTMVAFMSPDYWESKHCLREWDAAILAMISGTGTIIPVMWRSSTPPKLDAALAYVDLTKVPDDKDREFLRAVDGVIKRERSLPDILDPVTEALTNSSFATPNFTGREDELRALEDTLWEQRDVAALTPPPIAVSGLGGVGKSAIAREYARRHQHRYAGTWLVRSETQAEMDQDLEALAVKLNPALKNKDDNPKQAFIEAGRFSKTEGRPFLFVFDNVEKENDVPKAARDPAFHTIVTSRWEAWNDAQQIPITTLPEEAAAKLMLSITGRSAEEDGFQDLMSALDGLTLAIVQAGAYLRENKFESFAEYHGALQERLSEQAVGADPSEKLVSATFIPSIEKAEADAPGARDLLVSTAFFAPDDIPLAILAEEPGSAETKKAASALFKYSLVREGEPSEAHGPSLSLHRILQDVLRAQMEEDAKEALLKLSAKRLTAKVPNIASDVRNWPQIMPLAPHVSALSGFDTSAAGGDALSYCLNQLVTFYYGRASYGLAEPFMRRALKIDEANHDPDHPNIATALNNLAELLKAVNRLDEAEKLIRRSLDISEAHLDPSDPVIATRLNNLAGLFRARGQLEEAIPLIRRSLAIDEARYGPDHPEVATDLNNLAELLRATGRAIDAEPLFRRALAIDEASLGPDHPNVAIRLNNLARLLQATNRREEAELLYRRALAIDETSFGPDHPDVAIDLGNLAALLAQTKRAAEALPLIKRALRIFSASLPEGHPNITTVAEWVQHIEQLVKRQGGDA